MRIFNFAGYLFPLFVLWGLPASRCLAQDDLIIIEDEDTSNSPKADLPPPTWFHQTLDSAYLHADLDVRAGYQWVSHPERPWRMLGSLALDGGIAPASFADLHGAILFRLPMDNAVGSDQSVPYPDPYLDYQADLRFKTRWVSFQLGRFMIPWKATQAVALTDVLSPADYRRSPAFSQSWVSIPQWGTAITSSFGSHSLELIYLVGLSPTRGSLIASEQGGVQVGRYQSAWYRNRAEFVHNNAGPAFYPDDERSFWMTPQLGARYKTDIKDVDFSVLTALTYNGVPTPSGKQYAPLLLFGADASYTLGYTLVRGEFVIAPAVGELGKTALLKSGATLSAPSTTWMAFAVALEASYGDWVTASLELFDQLWLSVPGGACLYGVEAFGANPPAAFRVVQRVALGMSAEGAAWDKHISWRLKGEVGLLPWDILLGAESYYQWAQFGCSAGLYGDVFVGVPGSPGWMRAFQSSLGIRVEQKI